MKRLLFVGCLALVSAACGNANNGSNNGTNNGGTNNGGTNNGGTNNGASNNGANNGSATELPAGDNSVLLATATYEGQALDFDCRDGEEGSGFMQAFFQNAGLTLYQLRCRTQDQEFNIWLDLGGEEEREYDWTVEDAGYIGLGNPNDIQPLGRLTPGVVTNKTTVTRYETDVLIEGTFEAKWEGDIPAEVSGVFRIVD